MRTFDVVAIGAGPSGISTALKCAEQGYNVLIIEREKYGRSKPCGGILPLVCQDILDYEFGLRIPSDVLSFPQTLGLFYVPPSGRENSGVLRNYKLLNINRSIFDAWLCSVAIKKKIPILFNTAFLEFREEEKDFKVLVKAGNDILKFKTRYLIGADGALSNVRRHIFSFSDFGIAGILQEHWEAKGDFGEYFYMFLLSKNVTPIYGYVIPKNNLFIIGVGVPRDEIRKLQEYLERFKKVLSDEYNFVPISLIKKEVGFIPQGTIVEGKNNVIFVGDAGGFCNPFSGEGIRLAIETGIAASSAVVQADTNGEPLTVAYRQNVESIVDFILNVHKFMLNLNSDETRENFIRSELSRSLIINH